MILKLFDKFLSKLKTDRTTFATYILTLFTIYFLIDRIVEILFIAGSGLSVNYSDYNSINTDLSPDTHTKHHDFLQRYDLVLFSQSLNTHFGWYLY